MCYIFLSARDYLLNYLYFTKRFESRDLTAISLPKSYFRTQLWKHIWSSCSHNKSAMFAKTVKPCYPNVTHKAYGGLRQQNSQSEALQWHSQCPALEHYCSPSQGRRRFSYLSFSLLTEASRSQSAHSKNTGITLSCSTWNVTY